MNKISLSEKKIKEILKLDKGKRPDPKIYLSKSYINKHIEQFQNGISIILGIDQYNKYVKNNKLIGREDNTCFVIPTDICNKINNIYEYEKILNFPYGHLINQKEIIRLDIKNISNLNLRIPSGNELGTNEYWIPGGYTIYGIPEAISNNIPLNQANIKIYYFTN